MKGLLPGLLVSLSCLASHAVWIDADPSVARGGHEIDEGFALAQAFRWPELRVLYSYEGLPRFKDELLRRVGERARAH